MRRVLGLLTIFAAGCLLAPDAWAARILPIDQVRFVEASADAASGVETNFELDDDSAEDLGAFIAAVSADADTESAHADSSADQDSLIEAMGFHAFGTADAAAIVLDEPDDFPLGVASATSFFELTFEVAETGRFLLEGVISAFADEDGDSLASVLLVDQFGDILFEEVAGIDLEEFSEIVTLLPGMEYTLTALALADALAVDDVLHASAFGGYYVEMTMLPEPSTLMLLTSGLVGLAYFGRRRL